MSPAQATEGLFDTYQRYLEQAYAAGCPRDQIERFADLGYVAQPVQLDFHSLCRLADREGGPTRIGMGGSRGGSKSHAMLSQIGLDDCQRVPGLNVLYLRKLQKSAGEAAEDIIRKVFYGTEYSYAESRGRLVFKNGSKIRIGGFKDDTDIDKYVGIEYDIVAVEEATQLTWKKIQLLLGSCRTARDDWRARAYFSANPGGIGHTWYVQKFVKPWQLGEVGDWMYVHMQYTDNAFIKEEYKKYLNELEGGLRSMWTEGNWEKFEGMALPMLDYSVHTYDDMDIYLAPWWYRWRAVDWGLYSPFGCGWFALDPDIGRIYMYQELYQAGITDTDQAKLIFNRSNPDYQINLTYADPSMWRRKSHGRIFFSTADEYAANGVPLSPADNNREQGLMKVARQLGLLPDGKPGLMISRSCPHTWRTLTNLPLDETNPNIADHKHSEDHMYDVVRYALTDRKKSSASETEIYYEMCDPLMEKFL